MPLSRRGWWTRHPKVSVPDLSILVFRHMRHGLDSQFIGPSGHACSASMFRPLALRSITAQISFGRQQFLPPAHADGRKDVDNVEELEILTFDGQRMRLGGTGEQELAPVRREGPTRAKIYSERCSRARFQWQKPVWRCGTSAPRWHSSRIRSAGRPWCRGC